MDESTVGFKGRLSFRIYNKIKPTKWGIKVLVADSTNGYVFTLESYFGSQTTDVLIRPDLPVTACIVVHLAKKLVDSGNGWYHRLSCVYESLLHKSFISQGIIQYEYEYTSYRNRQPKP